MVMLIEKATGRAMPPPPCPADWSFQAECEAQVLALLQRGKSVLYVCPTGGGKTKLTCDVIARVRNAPRPWRVLVLVHRYELVYQWHDSLKRIGILATDLAGYGLGRAVTVGTIQTVHSRLKVDAFKRDLQGFDLVICDEFHHAEARTWKEVIRACENAQVLGLTATPWSIGGAPLGLAHVDTVVHAPSIPELIERGCLMRSAVFQPRHTINTRGVSSGAGDYVIRELQRVADQEAITLTAIGEYVKRCAGDPCVAFCTTVEHARNVAAAFCKQGWPSASVDGQMPREERQRVFRRLEIGSLFVVTSCELINEGVDIPVVSAMISLRPTKSARVWLQQVGRVLRVAPRKRLATIIDIAANARKLGLAEDPRRWTLKEGLMPNEKLPRVCPSCRRVHHHGERCIDCGRAMPPPAPPVVLRPVSGVPWERIKQMDYQRFTRFCHTLSKDELIEAAKIKGYSPGWAWNFIMRKEGRR